MKITASFVLDDEDDRDILDWLNRQSRNQKSAAIREALRGHIQSSAITLADVYHAVKELDRKIRCGLVVSGGLTQEKARPEEDPHAAAALDALAAMGM